MSENQKACVVINSEVYDVPAPVAMWLAILEADVKVLKQKKDDYQTWREQHRKWCEAFEADRLLMARLETWLEKQENNNE